MNINFTSVIESNNKYNIQIFQYVKAEQWDLLLEFILNNNIDYSIRDNSNIYLLKSLHRYTHVIDRVCP